MKKLTLALGLAAMASGSAAVAQEATDSASIHIGGIVPAYCTVQVTNPSVLDLDLSPNAGVQYVSDVGIWCNDGQGQAEVTYNSAYNGMLGSTFGYILPYDMHVADVIGDMSVTPITFNQAAGNDPFGNPFWEPLSVNPHTTGAEPADFYTDIITIVVAPL